MIDTRQLRIGNWVLFDNEWQMVDMVSLSGAVGLMGNGITNKEDQIDPIPLTSEILVKCGFESCTCDGWKGPFHIEKDLTYGRNGIKFQWLHQIQNFIFALNGEELIIEL